MCLATKTFEGIDALFLSDAIHHAHVWHSIFLRIGRCDNDSMKEFIYVLNWRHLTSSLIVEFDKHLLAIWALRKFLEYFPHSSGCLAIIVLSINRNDLVLRLLQLRKRQCYIMHKPWHLLCHPSPGSWDPSIASVFGLWSGQDTNGFAKSRGQSSFWR